MSLGTNADSLEVKQVTLSEMVVMCENCPKLCWDRTSRIVDNLSRAPRGWEGVFKSVAEERRTEDNEVCLKFCGHVKNSCPEVQQVTAYEKTDFRKVRRGTYPAGIPSIQEIARCEHAVESFSNFLFTLAHKPSKVSFASGPSTGEGSDAQAKKDEPPTDAHRKVLEGGRMDDEIMRRWSASRQGRMHMEEQGVIRSPAGVEAYKQEMKQKDHSAKAASGGTTPRWSD